jgi:CheY-like chemotaxis protein
MNTSPLKSILLVDDDEISNLFNKIFIDRLNIEAEVDIANNGVEALKFFNERDDYTGQSLLLTPCLLLLDIKMPVMDGWEFLSAYEEKVADELKKNVVIVMLTTSEDQADAIRAMNNPNIREFIQKPLSEDKFISLITKFFGEKVFA